VFIITHCDYTKCKPQLCMDDRHNSPRLERHWLDRRILPMPLHLLQGKLMSVSRGVSRHTGDRTKTEGRSMGEWRWEPTTGCNISLSGSNGSRCLSFAVYLILLEHQYSEYFLGDLAYLNWASLSDEWTDG